MYLFICSLCCVFSSFYLTFLCKSFLESVTLSKQGRIHDQSVVAGGWAGAVMRRAGAEWNMAGAVMWQGRGVIAQKITISVRFVSSKFSRYHPSYLPTDTASYRDARTHLKSATFFHDHKMIFKIQASYTANE